MGLQQLAGGKEIPFRGRCYRKIVKARAPRRDLQTSCCLHRTRPRAQGLRGRERTAGLPPEADFVHPSTLLEGVPSRQTNSQALVGLRGRKTGTCLAVQWVRLCTSNAGGAGLVPGQGTKIPHGGKKKKKKKMRKTGSGRVQLQPLPVPLKSSAERGARGLGCPSSQNRVPGAPALSSAYGAPRSGTVKGRHSVRDGHFPRRHSKRVQP